MKCPSCGAAELARETRNLTYTYKGQATVIEDVTADYCPGCGEAVLDRLNGNRYGAMTAAFRRQINGALVDPSFIADVRRKLDLDQQQAAEIFGGGVNAFSRYENGDAKPSVALVKLLRVLDRHPDLLAEVRAA